MTTTRKTKQDQTFLTLVNKQLEPFGKTYDDVKGDILWYTKFAVTPEQERAFVKWGCNFLQKALGLTRKQSEMEMDWFIMQWGIKSTKIINSDKSIELTEQIINSLKKQK